MNISKQTCASMVLQANPALSEKEAANLMDDMIRDRDLLAAQEKLTRGSADLAEAVNRRFDDEQRALAAKRRQAAITILRRQDFDNYSAKVRSEGFSTLDALEARLVGHARRFTGARQSVDARRTAIMSEWVGSMTLEIDAMAERHRMSRGELLKMVSRDRQFLEEFASERMSPGGTRNPLAREFAELYGRLSEAMRQRLHKAGGAVAHQEGGLPQSHDAGKLLSKPLGGKQGWTDFLSGLIDAKRSFPGRAEEEIRGILSDMYDSIVTGKDLTSGDAAPLPTPRNVASGLGRHRVIHFKDAASFLRYQDRYGRGNLIDAMLGELDRNSRTAGLMEIFGPNPERMIRSVMETDAQRIRDEVQAGRMDADSGRKRIQALNKAWSKGVVASGRIARWLAVLSGETMRADSVGLAKAFGIARSMQTVSKLGGATLSAISDGLTKSMSMRVNGANFLERTFQPFADYLKSYKGDKRRLAYELGFLLDSMQGSAVHRFDTTEGAPGKTSSLLHGFFKWSGLNFVTEQSKAGYAMWLSSFMGRNQGVKFDALP